MQTPILRGAKIVSFLLAAVTLTVIASFSLARPTQAEPLLLPECVAELLCDSTPPTISEFTLSRTIAGGTQNDVLVTATAEDAQLSEYTVTITRSNEGAEAEEVVSTVGPLPQDQAAISYGFNAALAQNFTSGKYTVTLVVRDEAKNEAMVSGELVVDNDGPVTTIGGGDIILKDGSITPAVTATDSTEGITYAWTSDAQNADGFSQSYTVKEPTFTPKSKGDYRYYLTTTDGLGNVTKDTPFAFGYAPQLETLPLSIIPAVNLTDKLVTDTPATPTIVAARVAQIDAARDVANNEDNSTILGSAIAAPGQLSPVAGGSAIAPTSSGWSIFGMLWYWWIMIIAIFVIAFYYTKKVVTTGVANKT